MSKLFQTVLSAIKTAYEKGDDSSQVFDKFVKEERSRTLKKYAIDALLNLSIMDLLKLLGSAVHLVLPKSGKGLGQP